MNFFIWIFRFFYACYFFHNDFKIDRIFISSRFDVFVVVETKAESKVELLWKGSIYIIKRYLVEWTFIKIFTT